MCKKVKMILECRKKTDGVGPQELRNNSSEFPAYVFALYIPTLDTEET